MRREFIFFVYSSESSPRNVRGCEDMSDCTPQRAGPQNVTRRPSVSVQCCLVNLGRKCEPEVDCCAPSFSAIILLIYELCSPSSVLIFLTEGTNRVRLSSQKCSVFKLIQSCQRGGSLRMAALSCHRATNVDKYAVCQKRRQGFIKGIHVSLTQSLISRFLLINYYSGHNLIVPELNIITHYLA